MNYTLKTQEHVTKEKTPFEETGTETGDEL